MSKVYFLKNLKKLKNATSSLFKDFYPKSSEVLVKIHFGEPGNKTALSPKNVKPVIDGLKFLKLNPIFIDTPVAYPSPRDTVKKYEKAVRKRGFDKLAPFIISNNPKKVKTKDFTAKTCKELVEAKNVLVISHIKGHSCSGFGGAIKNLGMGGLTKEGKSVVHTLCQPKFVSECQGCGICVDLCPAKAIKMIDGKAKINLKECWGCSICQLECPYECLVPKKAIFDDLLAQGASAVINNLPKNTFYINIVKNITKWCDCEINPGEIIAKDVGVLFSKNPVAIDKASVDLINKANKKDVFREANHKDPMLQLKFASEHTRKREDYKLTLV